MGWDTKGGRNLTCGEGRSCGQSSQGVTQGWGCQAESGPGPSPSGRVSAPAGYRRDNVNCVFHHQKRIFGKNKRLQPARADAAATRTPWPACRGGGGACRREWGVGAIGRRPQSSSRGGPCVGFSPLRRGRGLPRAPAPPVDPPDPLCLLRVPVLIKGAPEFGSILTLSSKRWRQAPQGKGSVPPLQEATPDGGDRTLGAARGGRMDAGGERGALAGPRHELPLLRLITVHILLQGPRKGRGIPLSGFSRVPRDSGWEGSFGWGASSGEDFLDHWSYRSFVLRPWHHQHRHRILK